MATYHLANILIGMPSPPPLPGVWRDPDFSQPGYRVGLKGGW